MTPLPISVCMISGAEAHRIGGALESVAGWTREVIVVLNEEVGDGTEEIAVRHGARVFREPWKGHVAQKNSAARKASQPWRLGLDADEVVSPALRTEIEETFARPEPLEQHAAFSFPRLTRYCGRWIRHGDWYPDRSVRLWKRDAAEWGGVDPHDKLLVRGRVGRLHGDLLHYNAEHIDRQVAKITSFGNDFVRHMQAVGRDARWLDLAMRPWWRFFRGYVLRLGFLDGWQGYHIAWMTAFHTINRYAKLREAANAGRPGTGDQIRPRS
ncbi:MAG: glycosyltransferase family 2 protein [Limisphaerales bacterium]